MNLRVACRNAKWWSAAVIAIIVLTACDEADSSPTPTLFVLPTLLPERSDRDRLITLLDRLLADKRVQSVKPLPEQVAERGQQVPRRLIPPP